MAWASGLNPEPTAATTALSWTGAHLPSFPATPTSPPKASLPTARPTQQWLRGVPGASVAVRGYASRALAASLQQAAAPARTVQGRDLARAGCGPVRQR